MYNLWKRYIQNVKKPQSNLLGYWQLKSMNKRHNALALWGMEHVKWDSRTAILDIGCGGGRNIAHLLKRISATGSVWGCDYAKASVEVSRRKNAQAILNGKTQIHECAVEQLPFTSGQFDTVTAFETVYFWNLQEGFREVFRILRENGLFLIVNEAQSGNGMEGLMQQIGFSVYTPDEISNSLRKAGFTEISVDAHPNGYWLTVTAKKSMDTID